MLEWLQLSVVDQDIPTIRCSYDSNIVMTLNICWLRVAGFAGAAGIKIERTKSILPRFSSIDFMSAILEILDDFHLHEMTHSTTLMVHMFIT